MSHTIKNYVLGELKRYIRYNSLKITFLKIRTKFFSRLRNRGFKKIWLRKQFATLKYENREKLMTEKVSDSSLSHSACQTLLEKKAASLKTKRSRLADHILSHNDKSLFPWNLTEEVRTIKKFKNHLSRNKPQTYQMFSLRGYLGKNFIPGFSWKNQQKQQKQQAGKPWQQKKSWRKKDDEEER